MLHILRDARTTTGATPTGDAADVKDADRGLEAHTARPPAKGPQEAPAPSGGVEWLPRQAPHRLI